MLSLLLLLAPVLANPGPITVHITTGDAVAVAKIVARAEGYPIMDPLAGPGLKGKTAYWFDSLDGSPNGPLLPGYTSIGFYIDSHIRSSISISDATGQAIDADTCEVFDYPELKGFQATMLRLSGAKRKSPRELADDAGCEAPKVLTRAVPKQRPSHR